MKVRLGDIGIFPLGRKNFLHLLLLRRKKPNSPFLLQLL